MTFGATKPKRLRADTQNYGNSCAVPQKQELCSHSQSQAEAWCKKAAIPCCHFVQTIRRDQGSMGQSRRSTSGCACFCVVVGYEQGYGYSIVHSKAPPRASFASFRFLIQAAQMIVRAHPTLSLQRHLGHLQPQQLELQRVLLAQQRRAQRPAQAYQ